MPLTFGICLAYNICMENMNWFPAEFADDFGPSFELHWDDQYLMFQPVRLLWWDDASYLEYQTRDRGGEDFS